ncbi:TetR/AcrR family transcriptional regulator [Ketobacter sp. MCCC 1A13808]|uniref:TetR/AcrR family transcriptional regulator n=1 Tax=Ketobacter sp. MCCC 1A13808 TaxID=2602738 RepID=UPI000F113161|nr:TetR/AcrR family transcriptional regulator [Ketobacter sp. MCCC 1A13808]MVF14403.1 TetR/AcrR family transcriptional regulator [Ketobacter sp. MCCC 1A13808]RLP52226.1 MAG: TetR/AcrR family transcriptional regulator [Ketobacter sp.]
MNTPEEASNETGFSVDRGTDARERILAAAEALFAIRGFEGVSTTQIAKVAGITQPLIHYHFKNKEALWKATISRLFSRLSEEFTAEVKGMPSGDSRRYMIEMVRSYVAFVAKYPQYGQFILREGVQESPRLEWMVEQWLRPLLGQFHETYEKGVEEGWIKDIPFPQLIMLITASASHFFSLAPLMKSLYGIDAQSPQQALAHSDAVVDVALTAIMREPSQQPAAVVM